jgi:hypothetical protein
MARYILVNIDNGAIMGQGIDAGNIRPFVSTAEAYETLARREMATGLAPEEIGSTFNAWTLCEVNPVERP